MLGFNRSDNTSPCHLGLASTLLPVSRYYSLLASCIMNEHSAQASHHASAHTFQIHRQRYDDGSEYRRFFDRICPMNCSDSYSKIHRVPGTPYFIEVITHTARTSSSSLCYQPVRYQPSSTTSILGFEPVDSVFPALRPINLPKTSFSLTLVPSLSTSLPFSSSASSPVSLLFVVPSSSSSSLLLSLCVFPSRTPKPRF